MGSFLRTVGGSDVSPFLFFNLFVTKYGRNHENLLSLLCRVGLWSVILVEIGGSGFNGSLVILVCVVVTLR